MAPRVNSHPSPERIQRLYGDGDEGRIETEEDGGRRLAWSARGGLLLIPPVARMRPGATEGGLDSTSSSSSGPVGVGLPGGIDDGPAPGATPGA